MSSVHHENRNAGGVKESRTKDVRATEKDVWHGPSANLLRKLSEVAWRPSTGSGNKTVGTILVVDDMEAIRKLVACMLRRAGYRVLLAQDGLHALEVCERSGHMIDLVITDMDMPWIGGVELCEVIGCRWPHIRTCLMTGSGGRELEQAVSNMGRPVMTKPFSRGTLLAKIGEGMAESAPGESRASEPKGSAGWHLDEGRLALQS